MMTGGAWGGADSGHDVFAFHEWMRSRGGNGFVTADGENAMGMTYEQMMALAERLGAVSAGVSADVIDAMPTWTYRSPPTGPSAGPSRLPPGGPERREFPGSALQRVSVRRGGRGRDADAAVHALCTTRIASISGSGSTRRARFASTTSGGVGGEDVGCRGFRVRVDWPAPLTRRGLSARLESQPRFDESSAELLVVTSLRFNVRLLAKAQFLLVSNISRRCCR